MSQAIMRVAAVLLFVSISAFLYKYLSVDSRSLYQDHYRSYELSTTRGIHTDDLLDDAYQDGNWSETLSIVNGIQNKSNKHFFLAGMAHMELNRYRDAIKSLESVRSRNRSTGDDYFSEEAEFYLALSYLAVKETDKAVTILQQISIDKKHLFHQVVINKRLDYQILKYKSEKKF